LKAGLVEGSGEAGCNDGTGGRGILGTGRAGATRFAGGLGSAGIGGAIGRSVSATVGGVDESEAVIHVDDTGGGWEGAEGMAAGGLVAVETCDRASEAFLATSAIPTMAATNPTTKVAPTKTFLFLVHAPVCTHEATVPVGPLGARERAVSLLRDGSSVLESPAVCTTPRILSTDLLARFGPKPPSAVASSPTS
jgi:hypothetical protein